jgi:lytic murein transglycosylase
MDFTHLAPINGSSFSRACREAQKGPAPCSLWQLVRLFSLLGLASALAILFFAPARAHAEPANPGFESFLQSLWPQAHKMGVARSTFDEAMQGVSYDPSIMEHTRKQSEFVTPLPVYLAKAVSQNRIDKGRAKAEAFAPQLAHFQQQYGVNSSIVLGVWGMETNFGGYVGDKNAIGALANLAYARYRGDYFRKELLIALKILQQGHVQAADMKASWAGAMGQTQFMPSSFLTYAVDGDGDGHKDIWNNVPDALASTANFLRRHHWSAGESWGYEVILPSGGGFAHGDGKQYRSFADWSRAGLRRADGGALPASGRAALLLPQGAEGPAFLTTPNFKVIKSYNNSTAYALGVCLLADRIAGRPALKTPWRVAVGAR